MPDPGEIKTYRPTDVDTCHGCGSSHPVAGLAAGDVDVNGSLMVLCGICARKAADVLCGLVGRGLATCPLRPRPAPL